MFVPLEIVLCKPSPFTLSFNLITIVSELPLSLTCVTSYSKPSVSPKFTKSPTPNTDASVTSIVVCPTASSDLLLLLQFVSNCLHLEQIETLMNYHVFQHLLQPHSPTDAVHLLNDSK